MPPLWKPNPEQMRYYFDTIVDEAMDELNAWEMKFISDIEWRVLNRVELTEAQENKLEQIYSDKTK